MHNKKAANGTLMDYFVVYPFKKTGLLKIIGKTLVTLNQSSCLYMY